MVVADVLDVLVAFQGALVVVLGVLVAAFLIRFVLDSIRQTFIGSDRG